MSTCGKVQGNGTFPWGKTREKTLSIFPSQNYPVILGGRKVACSQAKHARMGFSGQTNMRESFAWYSAALKFGFSHVCGEIKARLGLYGHKTCEKLVFRQYIVVYSSKSYTKYTKLKLQPRICYMYRCFNFCIFIVYNFVLIGKQVWVCLSAGQVSWKSRVWNFDKMKSWDFSTIIESSLKGLFVSVCLLSVAFVVVEHHTIRNLFWVWQAAETT